MAHKTPSTRTVAFMIVGICVIIAVGAYTLGVMRMKANEAEAKAAAEKTALATGEKNTNPGQSGAENASVISSASELLAVSETDIVIGDASAPVTIIEYSSLSCPHCAHFHNEVLPALAKKYIDEGKLRLAIRPFPLNAPALKGALLVACAPDDLKAQFVKVLFETQTQWAFTESFLTPLKQIAAVGGVSAETFDACMADKAKEDAILAQQQIASDLLKINSTPTFFINGTAFKDAPEVKEMSAAIDTALSK